MSAPNFSVVSRGVRIGRTPGAGPSKPGKITTRLFVTINSNRTDKPLEIARALDTFLTGAGGRSGSFAAKSSLEFYQDVGKVLGRSVAKRATIPRVDYGNVNEILSVKVDGVVEVGEGRKPHLHILIEIEHKTRIFFNRLNMKEVYVAFFRRYYPELELHVRPKYPNIQVKLLGNVREGADLENYLNKGREVNFNSERDLRVARTIIAGLG